MARTSDPTHLIGRLIESIDREHRTALSDSEASSIDSARPTARRPHTPADRRPVVPRIMFSYMDEDIDA